MYLIKFTETKLEFKINYSGVTGSDDMDMEENLIQRFDTNVFIVR